jgi:DUF971 family protein
MSVPTRIELHLKSAKLELEFGKDNGYLLDAEFLRVHSPSAEVRGHGGEGETLQTGKREVRIENIEVVGNYALKITFSDGHDTGLYSWSYLADLCQNKQAYWESYLEKIKLANASRDAV